MSERTEIWADLLESWQVLIAYDSQYEPHGFNLVCVSVNNAYMRIPGVMEEHAT